MAENNKIRSGDQDVVGSDDPFAELTAIMGLDKKLFVEKANPTPVQKLANAEIGKPGSIAATVVQSIETRRAAQPAARPASVTERAIPRESDFEIDLERELLAGASIPAGSLTSTRPVPQSMPLAAPRVKSAVFTEPEQGRFYGANFVPDAQTDKLRSVASEQPSALRPLAPEIMARPVSAFAAGIAKGTPQPAPVARSEPVGPPLVQPAEIAATAIPFPWAPAKSRNGGADGGEAQALGLQRDKPALQDSWDPAELFKDLFPGRTAKQPEERSEPVFAVREAEPVIPPVADPTPLAAAEKPAGAQWPLADSNVQPLPRRETLREEPTTVHAAPVAYERPEEPQARSILGNNEFSVAEVTQSAKPARSAAASAVQEPSRVAEPARADIPPLPTVRAPSPAPVSPQAFDDTLALELAALLGNSMESRLQSGVAPERRGLSLVSQHPSSGEPRSIPRSERERVEPQVADALAQTPLRDDAAVDSRPAFEAHAPARNADFAQGPAAHPPAAVVTEPDLSIDFDDDLEIAMTSALGADNHMNTTRVPVSEGTEVLVRNSVQDPYAALSAISDSLKPRHPEDDPTPSLSGAPRDPYDAAARQSVFAADVPDIATIDVPEQTVAVADDLDLPEFSYEARDPSSRYDDVDAEFNSLLAEMNGADPHQPAVVPESRRHAKLAPAPIHAGQDWSAQPFAIDSELRGTRPDQPHDVHRPAYEDDDDAARSLVANGADDLDRQFQDMEFAYDPEDDDEAVVPPPSADYRRPRRRGLLAAGIVGGVALLGGVAAFAMTFGNGVTGGGPVLVKADTTPIKVKPENPGGTVIPNQESKVYDSVAKVASNDAPAQAKLKPSSEEPMAMPEPDPTPADLPTSEDGAEEDMVQTGVAAQDGAPADAAAPAQQTADASQPSQAGKAEALKPVTKSEERVAASDDAADAAPQDIVAVAPRKVRTMVVKSDGTLVARADPPPATLEAPGESSASAGVVKKALPTVKPVTLDTDGSEAAEGQVSTPAKTAQSKSTPTTVPIAPTRPSDQPVTIVSGAKADQVASIAAAAPVAGAALPPATGSWAVQISSQPNEAAAQASYKDLMRKYGGVLNGHDTVIQKADIAGKGTFWRVRVAANGRDGAIKLCESYKAAGGTCFVTK